MKKVRAIIAIVVVAFLFTSMITAEKTTGKDIYLNSKCNTCHAIKSQDITSKQADKYPDLSNVGNAGLSKEDLMKYLNKELDYNGKKHPVKFKGGEEELGDLIDWLLTLKESK